METNADDPASASTPSQAQRRPAAPVLTRLEGRSTARAVSVFAPPFAGGRTLERVGRPHAATRAVEAAFAGEDLETAIPDTPAMVLDAASPVFDPAALAGDAGTLTQRAATTAADEALVPDAATTAADDAPPFPLDAFIVPDGSTSLPSGWAEAHAVAETLAERLENLAMRIRNGGLPALQDPTGSDELLRRIARVLTDFYEAGTGRSG